MLLIQNGMDSQAIERVKDLTEEVIKWNHLEEKIIMQRSKIDWLKMGDENSTFFYAYLKTKQKTKSIIMLRKNDGTVITKQKYIEQEILEFYRSLMGTDSPNLVHINVEAMRKGKQVNWEQRVYLQSNVTLSEIETALKGIGDLKSLGVDGYGAKFYKSSWNIIKEDVISAIQEFFSQGKMHSNFNKTVVTLNNCKDSHC
ncbi:uncharacterized protein LOC131597876 [Vicia villosa]|uniref:uncharacterized protein LOC131597876 n=1 Tax=Vicia villosa TaxID=3911 RepID=UPI00273CE56F|nr:uncharacterized protein LOC131597876 [Vicia villosa]